MPTVAELITDFRAIIDERTEQADSVLDSDIIRWYNNGLQDMADTIDIQAPPFPINAIAGTAGYSLPADYLRAKVLTLNGKPLEPTTLPALTAAGKDPDEQGTPTHYYEWSGLLYLWPVPSENGSAKLRYCKAPAKLTVSSQTPEIPERYHSLLNDYAFIEWYKRDDEPELMLMAQQTYRENLGRASMGQAKRESKVLSFTVENLYKRR